MLLGCSEKPTIYTFEATKDTSFIIERGTSAPTISLDIDGYLTDSALIIINYHKSWVKDDVKLEIPLDSGKISIVDKRWDFYDHYAKITFKHLNNKKGKLTIKASL